MYKTALFSLAISLISASIRPRDDNLTSSAVGLFPSNFIVKPKFFDNFCSFFTSSSPTNPSSLFCEGCDCNSSITSAGIIISVSFKRPDSIFLIMFPLIITLVSRTILFNYSYMVWLLLIITVLTMSILFILLKNDYFETASDTIFKTLSKSNGFVIWFNAPAEIHS